MLPPGLSMRSTTALTSSSKRALRMISAARIAADRTGRLRAIEDLARGDDHADAVA